MAAKPEWRKEDKNLYSSKPDRNLSRSPGRNISWSPGTATRTLVPRLQKIFPLLYALSYAVRMMPKQGFTPEGFEPYTVYALEGVWGLVDRAAGIDDKDNSAYTLMIRQPVFVTQEIAARAVATVQKKKPDVSVDEAVFGEMEDGLSVQMMHTGPYDDEPASFVLMTAFFAENNFERTSLLPREIYLSDARRTSPEIQKTVLRWIVGKKRSNPPSRFWQPVLIASFTHGIKNGNHGLAPLRQVVLHLRRNLWILIPVHQPIHLKFF